MSVTELEARFGPSWRLVAAVIARAEVLTRDEADALAAIWEAAWSVAWSDAGDAAWGAGTPGYTGAAGAARYAAWDAVWGSAVKSAAWGAVGDAAVAAAVSHLIGKDGFTQVHYDTLTGPWVSICGPIVAETRG